jgi:hypothetical protein
MLLCRMQHSLRRGAAPHPAQLLLLAATLVRLGAAAAAACTAAGGAPAATHTVGMLASLTGDLAPHGRAMAQAALMWEEAMADSG